MNITLAGPDDLGFWFLTDDEGNSYPFVTSHEDHLNAALLGWHKPEGITDEEAIMNALDWLIEHNGEDFQAPKQVAEFFKEITEDD